MNTTSIVASLCLIAGVQPSISALSYTGYGVLVSQDFDTLAGTGTIAWTNDSTIPGWELYNGAGTALPSITGGTGSSSTGGFYSFGSAGQPERALGAVGGGAYFGNPTTGSVSGAIAISLVNNSSLLLNTITISYAGEQWRDSGVTTAHSLVLQYGKGTSYGAVSWVAAGSGFDFSSPQTGTAGIVDGNVAGLDAGIGGSINGVNWGAGETLWIRWVDVNETGADHGLAVDDFTFVAVPEPSVSGLLLAALGLAVRRRR